ncbi:hypothetical protein L1987_39104 [Smallanthus sonchifolius]|uniref:Uncharacterized protein n=1 Tax=Smallanthus sonchifolius TaxID=185202 RepID=A0ACB9HKH3_9ASTR|nr:hypothetical protein L1987_39104 [Smallanthus sonchifolius]
MKSETLKSVQRSWRKSLVGGDRELDSFSDAGIVFSPEQASPTLAAAYSISWAVNIPVMCASGLSAVTAPMAITAGAAGVVSTYLKINPSVGSAINKLNDVVAEVRSIADSIGLLIDTGSELANRSLRL